VAPERVTAVAHGVDPRRFRPGLRGGARRVGAPYVLFAAAVHPRKNLAALRDAMAGLARRGWPHVLVVAGGPAADRADSSDLEEAAGAELPGAPGRVRRVEALDTRELASLMAGAAAFCLPSHWEGFGLTALEAMACGTPVVVSDRGALPEVVGDAGLVVSPDAADVEEALDRVLGDAALAERLGRAGRARAEGFTWRRTAEGWTAVLRDMAG
jgi:alpha-1,3-rhamnosyl/mannosyltransferase